MLSRFEEIVIAERDQHDRFPAVASLAWSAGFLYRPIVDEYAELLWCLMKRLWPGLERRRREGQIRVSCDVDQPFDRTARDPVLLAKVLRHDLVKRRTPGTAARRVANAAFSAFSDYRFDEVHTFDWYMDACERNGHRAAFYFIADHSAGAIDGAYEIDEARILRLIRNIADRGHEIGMHGSYNTFRDAAQIRREGDRLGKALEAAGLTLPVAGNRQHYLRWDAAQTPDHLEEAGFGYDTSGSFADRPGFRYGTSWFFPIWSWQRMAPLRILERPLVVMECSVISESYLGLGHSTEANELIDTLRRRALRYGGDFTVLWHNSELSTGADREIFLHIVTAVGRSTGGKVRYV